jgi:hypothetical protein
MLMFICSRTTSFGRAAFHGGVAARKQVADDFSLGVVGSGKAIARRSFMRDWVSSENSRPRAKLPTDQEQLVLWLAKRQS